MVYYSLNNDVVDVFMKETLCGQLFMYGGVSYDSVNDCFNNRKFSRSMWKPSTVPKIQQNKLEFYGFLTNSGECVVCNSAYTKQMRTQMEVIIKAKLFAMYYEQIDKVHARDIGRFNNAYQQCKAIATSITLNTEVCELKEYEYSKAHDVCCIYVGKNSSVLGDVDIAEYGYVHVDMRNYETMCRTYDMIIRKVKVNEYDCPRVVLHARGIDDMILTAIQNRYAGVEVVTDDMPRCDVDVLMLGCVDADKVLNWDNVYLI